ncbi:dihydropteroate synthase [Nocardioides aestuarii]|uniref:Dihydropteroate synthase n=1 Tax=Nocardioides aestuarii TaxID=252231 RepID=A0ABW4TL93_9ACTN
MITLAALAELHEQYADDLARPVEPVRVSDDVVVGDGSVTLMGVVNLSKDSTYRESIAASTEAAVRKGLVQAAQGAAMIDVGAEASNDDAGRVDAQRQVDQLVPVIEGLAPHTVVSVETYRPLVVKAALEAGAKVVNLTGREDEDEMLASVAEHDATLLMCFGTAANVREAEELPRDTDLAPFLVDHFTERLDHARSLGVTKVVVDPGMGFSYQNLASLDRTRLQTRVITQTFRLRALGVPAASVLPHNLDIFEDQFRKAEGFFAVLAALGGVHLLRIHEIDHVATVLRAMDLLEVS